MMKRFMRHLCPRCLDDDVPVSEHPAVKSLEESGDRIDRMLDALRYDLRKDESGHAAADMLGGRYHGEKR